MPAYWPKDIESLKSFKQFDKYLLRRKGYRKIRFFHLKAKGTIKSYTRIIKDYVKYMHIKEGSTPFPVTEGSLRRYIKNLDLHNFHSSSQP